LLLKNTGTFSPAPADRPLGECVHEDPANACLSLLGAAFAVSATPAHADRDAVHFFSNIHVKSGATVHDAVCFFCNVDIDGEAQGDVVVFFAM